MEDVYGISLFRCFYIFYLMNKLRTYFYQDVFNEYLFTLVINVAFIVETYNYLSSAVFFTLAPHGMRHFLSLGLKNDTPT